MPTIGVSIAVPDPWGEELRRRRLDLGDVAAEHIPTHVTLLPPVEITEERLSELVPHLRSVAARTPPFRMHLRGTGTFRPVSPVVFVNVVAGISACEQLSAGVLDGPVEVDRRFPYHPHVTVAHHLDDAGLDRAFDELGSFEASFVVDRVWLYQHRPDLGWQPEAAFVLRD